MDLMRNPAEAASAVQTHSLENQMALMVIENRDLHGNAPDKAEIGLLLIDVINDLDFPEGEMLLRHALPMARRLVDLKRRARTAGVPVIHVNDNFGRWRSNFNSQVEHCMKDGGRGEAIVEILVPEPEDYFVLKPKHSGFFSTTLDTLLEYLGVKTVILTGIAGNICVLFTANDAYMRDFALIVPGDCVASNTAEENDRRPGADEESAEGEYSALHRTGFRLPDRERKGRTQTTTTALATRRPMTVDGSNRQVLGWQSRTRNDASLRQSYFRRW